MAKAMRRIAAEHPGRQAASPPGLPLLVDVRRALNAARADAQLLVVVHGEGREGDEFEAKLAQLAWSEELIGRFLYVRASKQTDWSVLEGSTEPRGVGALVVEPGEFGLDGKVLAAVSPGGKKLSAKPLLAALGQHDWRCLHPCYAVNLLSFEFHFQSNKRRCWRARIVDRRIRIMRLCILCHDHDFALSLPTDRQ